MFALKHEIIDRPASRRAVHALIGDRDLAIEIGLRLFQADELAVGFVESAHVRHHALDFAFLLWLFWRQTFYAEGIVSGKAFKRRIQQRFIARGFQAEAFRIIRGRAMRHTLDLAQHDFDCVQSSAHIIRPHQPRHQVPAKSEHANQHPQGPVCRT
jgi:hypothetical protein